jgi:hypothetical protein
MKTKKTKFNLGGPNEPINPYGAVGESGPKEQKAQADYDLDNKSKTKGYSNAAAAKQWSTGTVAPYAPIKKNGGSVIKGSSLRRQTSTSGLRTSRKFK